MADHGADGRERRRPGFRGSSVWWHDVDHGDMCDCMLLARAVGTSPSSTDLSYCQNVLQKHWRLRCNHGCRLPGAPVTPQLPPLDIRDPLQALLLANVPVT